VAHAIAITTKSDSIRTFESVRSGACQQALVIEAPFPL
jgi:hypothetical protein